ncbi:c-type cytochrome [Luteimonas sp. R10]|uniref:c-type cytochrome n=1 Tax=Luteimonas sp. R10 TaxID=3108176 RepID=UPI003089ABE4|nr:c-type cytochrome [Luteimonas sp. R10]
MHRASSPVLALLPLLALAGAAHAQDAAAEGEQLYRTRCAACHALDPGQNRIGPHLAGVVGRAAGSVEGARYTDAMRASGIVWDSETLDAYLANPRQQVPGTSMMFALPDATQRQAIIAFLQDRSTTE